MTSSIITTTLLCLLSWTIQPVRGLAQKQYYSDTQQMTNCPCEAAKFFKNNPYEGIMRPNGISPHCRICIPSTDTVPEGFYFKKRSKKNPKPTYPKTSSIIRF